MSQPTTHITIFLRPDQEEMALYHIGEALIDKEWTIIDMQEVETEWKGELTSAQVREKHLTLALSSQPWTGHLKDIYDCVAIGIILGFVVHGEIALSYNTAINNLNGQRKSLL